MTDLNFPKIIEKLNEIHEKFPDIRFGLALQTALDNHKKRPNIDLHNMSSKEILSAIQEFINHTSEARNNGT